MDFSLFCSLCECCSASFRSLKSAENNHIFWIWHKSFEVMHNAPACRHSTC